MNKIALIPFVCLLSACSAVGPDYKKPDMVVPTKWQAKENKTPSAAFDQWWLSFHDPFLLELIKQADISNLDIHAALLRVQNARVLRSQTIAAGLPSFSAKSSESQRLNNTNQTSGASNGSNGGGGFGVGNQEINIFQAGFDAQWELDFFGGTRRAIEAANANVEIEIENSRMVLISLYAELARYLIECRSAQQQRELTQAMLNNQQETLTLLKSQQQAGLNNELAIAQIQAQIASTSAQLPIYQQSIEQNSHALSVLLGKEPNALNFRLKQALARKLDTAETLDLSQLPSELLQRRPDLRRAERQLAESNAEIGIATADLYPRVNLAAFIGLQNMRLSDFTPVGKSWSSSASVTMPLFNWGKLKAVVKSKRLQYQQYVIAYQTAILTAFREVEDALTAYHQQKQQQALLSQAVSANELALQLAMSRYQQGLSDFLDVLTAQNTLYASQKEVISNQQNQQADLLALYKALGGGWQNNKQVADEPKASLVQHISN